jgi:hypothetical protein
MSKKVILADDRQLRTRYQTVFRESGEELQVRAARRVAARRVRRRRRRSHTTPRRPSPCRRVFGRVRLADRLTDPD